MDTLNIAPNLTSPDDFYAELLQHHDGLSNSESQALNARLILILSNHIGDSDILIQAMNAAASSSK